MYNIHLAVKLFNFVCFPSECLIKSLINPRNVTKMKMTFGTWMKDTALLNDERIWVAEHFSGGLGQKIRSFQDQIRIQDSATDPHGMVEYMMSNQLDTICFQQVVTNIVFVLPQVVF